MLSGITAHCDPSFHGDLRCEISVFVQSSGDVHAEPNREIHVSDLRELSCKFLSDNNIKQCRGPGRPRPAAPLAAQRRRPRGGRHWYYRIDRPTNRHCWYLRDEGEKLAQSAPPNSSPAPKPVSPKPEPAMQRSVSDAHAELSAQLPV